MIKVVLLDIDGVITDGKISFGSSGEEVKSIDMKDVDAIFALKRKGFKVGVITGENTPFVDYFRNRFEFDFFYSGCKDKLSAIKDIEAKHNIKKEEICYVGDATYDIEAIKYVGLGVCPSDAIEKVKNVAMLVLKQKGGVGCIDELLNILENDGMAENKFFDKIYKEHLDAFQKLFYDKMLREKIAEAADIILKTFRESGQLLLCGNGGSAADAQHIATEFVSRFYMERKALNAEALTINTSSLTAIGNDYTFDKVFSRQVEAKGRKGDVLIGISTSGKSANVIEAMKYAKSIGMSTIAFTGENNNTPMAAYADVLINVPSNITPRVQEVHIFLGHMICEYVEKELFA